jgi:hypothetical protein
MQNSFRACQAARLAWWLSNVSPPDIVNSRNEVAVDQPAFRCKRYQHHHLDVMHWNSCSAGDKLLAFGQYETEKAVFVLLPNQSDCAEK